MGGVRLIFILLLPVFLVSCTNAGIVPPQNLASVLTPQSTDSETTGTASDELETVLSDDAPTSETVTASDDKVETPAPTTETQTASAEEAKAEATTDEKTDTVTAETADEASDEDTGTEVAQSDTGIDTTTALAPRPKKAVNPFSAFLKSQARNNRPRADVGDDRQQARSTFRKPSRSRQVARLTINRSSSNSARRGSNGSLPGVKVKNVFAIDEEETGESDYLADSENEAARVASLTNMARRGDHGLLLQRPGVSVGCFPPALLTILKSVERRFGRAPVVTSGYRSPAYNRKIRGAKKSLHVRCLAADIQVQGVSKWTLAKYLRSLPGRGGVGTYCHTRSVHIDIGTQRDWNRRCRRKKKA